MTTTPRTRTALLGIGLIGSWSIMMASAFLLYFTNDSLFLIPFIGFFISTLIFYYLFLSRW